MGASVPAVEQIASRCDHQVAVWHHCHLCASRWGREQLGPVLKGWQDDLGLPDDRDSQDGAPASCPVAEVEGFPVYRHEGASL